MQEYLCVSWCPSLCPAHSAQRLGSVVTSGTELFFLGTHVLYACAAASCCAHLLQSMSRPPSQGVLRAFFASTPSPKRRKRERQQPAAAAAASAASVDDSAGTAAGKKEFSLTLTQSGPKRPRNHSQREEHQSRAKLQTQTQVLQFVLENKFDWAEVEMLPDKKRGYRSATTELVPWVSCTVRCSSLHWHANHGVLVHNPRPTLSFS